MVPIQTKTPRNVKDRFLTPFLRRLLAKGLLEFLDGCDFCGFNLRKFDLRVLRNELARCNLLLPLHGRRVVDAVHIYHEREKRDLTAALKFYCGMERDGAHGAEADVLATLAILDAQVVHYADLPRTIDELHALQVEPDAIDFDGHFRRNAADGRIYFNFGKYKNEGSRSIPGWWSGGASQPLQSDEPFRNEEHRRWNPDRPNLRLGGGPAGSPYPRWPRSCWRSRSASAGAISTWE